MGGGRAMPASRRHATERAPCAPRLRHWPKPARDNGRQDGLQGRRRRALDLRARRRLHAHLARYSAAQCLWDVELLMFLFTFSNKPLIHSFLNF